MKLIFCDYTMESRTPRTAWIKNYSDYKLGIKVCEGGVAKENIKLFDGDVELTPDDEKTNDYTVYTMKSEGPTSKVYDVKVGDAVMKLKMVVTDSSVAEVGSAGGSTSTPTEIANDEQKIDANGNVWQKVPVLSDWETTPKKYEDHDIVLEWTDDGWVPTVDGMEMGMRKGIKSDRDLIWNGSSDWAGSEDLVAHREEVPSDDWTITSKVKYGLPVETIPDVGSEDFHPEWNKIYRITSDSAFGRIYIPESGNAGDKIYLWQDNYVNHSSDVTVSTGFPRNVITMPSNEYVLVEIETLIPDLVTFVKMTNRQ